MGSDMHKLKVEQKNSQDTEFLHSSRSSNKMIGMEKEKLWITFFHEDCVWKQQN